jgi:hypothetical protein
MPAMRFPLRCGCLIEIPSRRIICDGCTECHTPEDIQRLLDSGSREEA